MIAKIEPCLASEAKPASDVACDDLVDDATPLTLGAAEGGERLDKWLATQLPASRAPKSGAGSSPGW